MTFAELVLMLFAASGGQELLHWDKDLNFAVRCDGLYGDLPEEEPLTGETLPAMVAAFSDVLLITGSDVTFASHLFIARLRNLRPDNHRYPSDSRLWPLFDALPASGDPLLTDPAADVGEADRPVACHPPALAPDGPDHCGLCGEPLPQAPTSGEDWPTLQSVREAS